MTQATIAFIGGGNMAHSLIGGLIAAGTAPDRLTAADPNPQAREALAGFGVHTTDSNTDAVEQADAVVLAVKPQVLAGVVADMADTLRARQPLIVSIAAGIRAEAIGGWLSHELPVVRAMPNTPALVRSGATALFANDKATEAQRELAESILRAVGVTVWLDDERQMDAVTAISGSGPAYFFLVTEALQQAAEDLGLDPDTARLLTRETAFGASKMMLESAEDVAELRRRVTSPGGTTEQALAALEDGGLRQLFQRATRAAAERSRELADELGGGNT